MNDFKTEPEQVNPIIVKTAKELSNLSPEELARQFLELRAEALTDKVTGVLSENGLIDVFGKIVNILQNTQKELQQIHKQEIDTKNSHLIGFRGYGVWMVDLIGLHKTNDEEGQGWETGNRKLRNVAEGLQKVFRRSADSVARIGSDEFVVLSPNANNDPDVAELMINKLRESLPPDVKVNAVIGWYDKDIDPETAISEVKNRMAEAKKAGPLDETGRSLGFGLAKAGKYVK